MRITPKDFLRQTDPIKRISLFEYDSVGRITKQTLPDAHQILYTYDANGNLTSLTPPAKLAHSFDYTSVDLTSKYTPPMLNSMSTVTSYHYNKDQQIVSVIRPDSGIIETIYDTVVVEPVVDRSADLKNTVR